MCKHIGLVIRSRLEIGMLKQINAVVNHNVCRINVPQVPVFYTSTNSAILQCISIAMQRGNVAAVLGTMGRPQLDS